MADYDNKLTRVKDLKTVADRVKAVEDKQKTYGSSGGSSGGTIWDLLNAETEGGAGLHNSIFRGKNLGSTFTDEQSAAIQAGTFKDLWIGDYWEMTIDGTEYTFRIADFDYYLHCGTPELKTHHVVIVPDNAIYNDKMNTKATTADGYAGSAMHTSNLEKGKTIINDAFGSGHILTYLISLTNKVTSNVVSGYIQENCTVELMSELMVYGCTIMSFLSNSTPSTMEKSQLSLFRLRHDMIAPHYDWWLRDIMDSSQFVYIQKNGSIGLKSATNSLGIRPYFCIY